jgi:hypothetical protein
MVIQRQLGHSNLGISVYLQGTPRAPMILVSASLRL